jgi:hypothetical protein
MRLLLLNEAASPANQCSKSESLEHNTVASLQYDSVAHVPVASIWILFILSHLKLDDALFVWLISHQSAVFFSHNKPAISNQPAVLFSQNKSAPAISHQPNEQAGNCLFLYVPILCQFTFDLCRVGRQQGSLVSMFACQTEGVVLAC